MACKTFWECLLKVLNFLLILVGLAMIGYGVYLFVEYKTDASTVNDSTDVSSSMELVQLGRPMLLVVSVADSIFEKLPKAWFIYLFTGIGIVLVVIACCGCIGTAARNGCCLSCYSVLVILLILVELGAAVYIFFDKSWKENIPVDRTGNFDTIYQFVDQHWKIIRWVALGIIIFEALVFLLALVVRAINRPAQYDSDDEYIGGPRQQTRQPFISRDSAPATGVPVSGALDQRPSKNDAWSSRMREKNGFGSDSILFFLGVYDVYLVILAAKEWTRSAICEMMEWNLSAGLRSCCKLFKLSNILLSSTCSGVEMLGNGVRFTCGNRRP